MDFHARQQNIKRSYIVCSTGRSGSTLLCKTLAQLNQFGNPDEYFHHRNHLNRLQLKEKPEGFISYFESVLDQGLSHNGVFAIKMHWWQLYDFWEITRQLDEFKGMNEVEILHDVFPNLKFIYIWRQDMIAQAVSTEIALQTGEWVKGSKRFNAGSSSPPEEHMNLETGRHEAEPSIKFRPLKIYRWEQKFKDQNRRWQQFFTDYQLDHHELTYERLTSNFEQEVMDVIKFLELEPEVDHSRLKMPTRRQANTVNEEFTTCYKAFPPVFLRGMNKLNVLFS
ncbi:MAG: Stf0 family sulfotransferase [Leptolyngbyaceae bacterium]|nr:Stf0 family sulfotransferase [Leptolyngbyaceae bacterium]